MATMVAKDKDLVKLVNELIALDFDAIEAYEAAITRIQTASDKEQLTRFMGDHQQHVTDLSTIVREFGQEPQSKADYKKILAKGKVVLAGLIDEESVLGAMKSNEDETTRAYEKAAQQAGLPERVLTAFQKNLGDERRHRSWLEQRLAAMKKGKAAHA